MNFTYFRALRRQPTIAILILLLLGIGTLVPSAEAQNVIAWGSNSNGETDVPASATNVIAVAAGWNHSLALRDDGSVLCWGSITNAPPAATNIVSISAGARHNIALRADGRVVSWGDNTYGQTNENAYYLTNVMTISAGEFSNVAVRSNGTMFVWGQQPYIKPELTNIVVLAAAGAGHGIGFQRDGTMVSWNSSIYSSDPEWVSSARTPAPFSVTVPIAFAAASSNNFVLQADGTVNVWGRGRQPTIPASITNVVQLAVSTNCNLALRSDGTIAAWGTGSITNVPVFATNIIAIAAGRSHGLAVSSDGSPRIIGSPVYEPYAAAGNRLPLMGRVLGNPPMSVTWMADGIPIPGATNPYPQISAAIGTDNVGYQLVISNSLGSVTSSVAKVKVLPVNVWGDNANRPQSVPAAATNALAIAAGSFHLLAIQTNGAVIAWGKNFSGQATVPKSASNAVAIAGGADHSLALRANGTVVAWGRNWDGQTNVPLSATNITGIAAGWAHSIALRADGTVLAWGNNQYGQTNIPLYVRDVRAVAAGSYHNLALKSDGSVVAWGNWEDYPVPSAVSNVVAIAAGFDHNLAIRSDGLVIAWGDNAFGQSDVPLAASNVVAVSAGYYHSMALRADGTVLVWGKGYYGITNVPTALSNVASIAAGEHLCAVLVRVGRPTFNPATATIKTYVGGQTFLSTSISGTQPLSCQWFFNGMPIDGATNQFLLLDDVQPSDAGPYTLIVTNSLGETNSFTGNVVVDSIRIVSPPVRTNVPPHTSFVLSPIIRAEGPTTFQWRRNGENLVDGNRLRGSNQEVLEFNTTGFEHTGNYELIVSNSSTSITGLVAQVNITPILVWGENSSGQLEIPFTASNVVAIAAGSSHCLALTSHGNVIGWGDNTYGQSTIPAAASNVVSVSAGISHSLAARSDGTVVAWGTNQFEKCTVPASATNIVAVIAGDYFSAALRSDGTLMTWGGSVSFPYGVTNLVAIAGSKYRLLGLHSNGTAAGYFLPSTWTNLIAVAAGYNRLALRADGKVINDGNSPIVPSTATNIIAIASGYDRNLVLRNTGSLFEWAYNYQKEFRPAIGSVLAISAGNAYSMALLSVSTNLSFVEQPSSDTVLAGETAGFQTQVSGQGPLTYQWYLNGSPVPAATNANLSFSATSDGAGDYFVRVANGSMSITSSVATLTVLVPPSISLQPLSKKIAAGSSVEFSITAAGSAPFAYQWQFGEDNIPGATNANLQLAGVTVDQSGSYTVQISNPVGTICSSPATLTVVVPPVLTLDLGSNVPALSFTASTNSAYTLQYSTNLSSSNWLDLITFSNGPSPFRFIDWNAGTNETRFYRIMSE